jgi:hypothetical protein
MTTMTTTDPTTDDDDDYDEKGTMTDELLTI